MLKQSFDNDVVARVLTQQDVWKWSLWSDKSEQEGAIRDLADSINRKGFEISSLKEKIKRGKPTYQADNVQDIIAIRILDRYIRRIYKIRQSDRQKIIGQLKTILRDSGDYVIMRLDIDKCYESINFEMLVRKLDNDVILAPTCVKLLKSIVTYCNANNINGLPRGLSISPTLAELYLEPIDRFIKNQDGVIYSARYVDDIFILVDKNFASELKVGLTARLTQLGLSLNDDEYKQFTGESRVARFDYLGYAFEVSHKRGKANSVDVSISKLKLNKIKAKIAISLNEHIKQPNIHLLKQRLNYLSTLKVINSSENGTLMGGIAFNYKHVSDDYASLKAVDGFLKRIVNESRFLLSSADKSLLLTTSFYSSVRKKKVGKFSRRKATIIKRVWQDV